MRSIRCKDKKNKKEEGPYFFLKQLGSFSFFRGMFRMRVGLAITLIFVSLSCATSLMIQPQINSLVIAEKFNYALKTLEKNKELSYGKHNRLLYFSDYGLVLHFAGRYKESIDALEKAKIIYDELFTKSLTNEASTWLVNDNLSPYRGEDFERVMINIFQALNFSALGDFEEALVEARDVDRRLNLINQQYEADQKNVYREDAFARLLMGILYEAEGAYADLNDAFISNVKALESYEQDYYPHYKIEVPQILKENILATAKFMGQEELRKYERKWHDVQFSSLEERKKGGEIYLVHYHGLSPVKQQISIPIPLPGVILTKLAFPQYDKRKYDSKSATFKAVGGSGAVWEEETQLGEDIAQIAIQNLENRRVRVIAKAVARSGGKYLIEKKATDKIREKYGEDTSEVFKYLGSLYNVASEQADLRSWQTLPGEIRITRLLLDPGQYEFFFNADSLGTHEIRAGEKKFFIERTSK